MRGEALDCLRALVSGLDHWDDFWSLFGGFIQKQLNNRQILDASFRDDVFQDVALRLIRNDYQVLRHYLAGDTSVSFLALLGTVVNSVVIDQYRRNKRWKQLSFESLILQREHDSDGLQTSGRPWARDPARRLARDTRLLCVFQELSAVLRDPLANEILRLRYVEEHDVNKIALRFGLSANAVSQRLRVYHRRLRELLGEELRGLIDE